MLKSVHLNAEYPNQWVVIGVFIAGVLIATYGGLRFMLLWVVICLCIVADFYRRRRRARSTAKEECRASGDVHRLGAGGSAVKEDCGAMRVKDISVDVHLLKENWETMNAKYSILLPLSTIKCLRLHEF